MSSVTSARTPPYSLVLQRVRERSTRLRGHDQRVSEDVAEAFPVATVEDDDDRDAPVAQPVDESERVADERAAKAQFRPVVADHTESEQPLSERPAGEPLREEVVAERDGHQQQEDDGPGPPRGKEVHERDADEQCRSDHDERHDGLVEEERRRPDDERSRFGGHTRFGSAGGLSVLSTPSREPTLVRPDALARSVRTVATDRLHMGSFTKDLFNGVLSAVISVVITVALADEDDGPWNLRDMVLSVAISSFLSGYFTSYFANGE